jgi:flagellar motor switch protein FliM
MHSEQAGSDKRWSQTLTQQLQIAEIELSVPLGHAQVTLGDIVKLKVGDVVPIVMSDKVRATVDAVPVMECSYGIRNGQYALKIERFLNLDNAE